MSNVLTSNIQRLALERKTQCNVFRSTLGWTGFVGLTSLIYCPFPAALFPSLVASASVMYFPFFVVP